MATLGIVGVTAITMDDPALVEEATIVVEDGLIASVTSRGAAPSRTMDGRGLIALPGLVNAHAHTLESLLRGCGGQLTSLPWIRRTHAVMDGLDDRGAFLATRLALVEMVETGTTAYLDPEIPTDRRFEAMARAATESGLRGGLTLLLEDRGGYHQWSSRTEPRLTADEVGLLDVWHGAADGRLATWVGPSVLSAVTPEFGQVIRAVADARGLRIAFHCAEAPEDREDTMKRAGIGPVAFADGAGLVSDRTVIAHGVHLTDDEIATLADRGVSVVHCPSSNAKLGSGVAPVPRFLEAGVTVALGTDGGSSNDTYDLFAEIRMAGLIHRAVARDPGVMSAEQVLRMATVHGARALGVTSGTLAPGRAADIVLLDATHAGFAPTANVVDSLVYSGSSAQVRHVIVGGESLVRDGRVVGVDRQALVAEAAEAARAAIESAGVADDVRSPWMASLGR